MVFFNGLVASNKVIRRFQVDLSQTAVPVGTTGDTNGLLLNNLLREFPGAEKVKVTYAGIKAVNACTIAGSASALTVFLQKNGGNNVQIPSSGACSISVSGNAIAAGTRDEEIGEDVATKTGLVFSGANTESLKLILGATTATTATSTDSGIVEIVVECEVTNGGLPRA